MFAAVAALLVVGIAIGRWTAPGTASNEVTAMADAADDTDARVFRVAAVDHLGQLDTFLSLFRADASIGRADPETGQSASPNLSVARQTIDAIEMLKEKTRGNLDEEETKLLEELLYELHMRYVEAQGGSPGDAGPEAGGEG